MGFLETTLHRRDDEPTHTTLSPLLKIITGVVLLLIGWLVGGLTTTVLLVLIVAALFIQQVYGATVWFTQEVPETP